MAKEKKKTPVIKVCCGSHCKEKKSGKVAKALEKEIAKTGLEGNLRVKKCDCLGKCKSGPVIEFAGGTLTFEELKPKDAPKVIEKIMAAL